MTQMPRPATHSAAQMPKGHSKTARDLMPTAHSATVTSTDAIIAATRHDDLPPHAVHTLSANRDSPDPDQSRPAWTALAERALTLRVPERQAFRSSGQISPLSASALSAQAEFMADLIADHPDLDGVAHSAIASHPDPAYRSTPLARTLTSQQITAMIAAQDDPWAMDRDTKLLRPPYDLDLINVLTLARLCATCVDQDSLDCVLSDGCATVITCSDDAEMAALSDCLTHGLKATPQAAGTAHAVPQRRIHIASIPADPGVKQSSALGHGRALLAETGPVVILATATTALPPILARLPVLKLAPVDPDVILFALRELQSATGQISTAAVCAAMPAANDLAALPVDALMLAFRSKGPIRTAACLADLCAALTPAIDNTQTEAGPVLEELAGLGAARLPLSGIVSDLRAYASGTLPWADVTSGLILAGPPGTGKTTLAAAIARSAGLPLIATTCSDWHLKGRFYEMLDAMAAAFEAARSRAPAVLFIDEIDTLGSREGQNDQNSTYNRHIINAALSQIDGLQSRDGVMIIGATNYPEMLDPALTRPGRLGKTIRILPPLERDLADVFRYHLKQDLPQADLSQLARAAAGASMADVMGAVQAARATARAADRAMTAADLKAAVDDRYLPVPDALRLRRAVYAAGRIVAAHVTASAEPLSVTICGDDCRTELRARAHASDPQAILASLICSLAGRAAEEDMMGSASGTAGGSSKSDLAQATREAIKEDLSLGRGTHLIWHAAMEDPAVLFARHKGLRDTVNRRLLTAYSRARHIVAANRAAVEAIAAHLVVDGHIDRETLRDLLLFCTDQPPALPS